MLDAGPPGKPLIFVSEWGSPAQPTGVPGFPVPSGIKTSTLVRVPAERAAQFVGERPRHEIRGAAGSEADNAPDRPDRIFLRCRRDNGRQVNAAHEHVANSSTMGISVGSESLEARLTEPRFGSSWSP